MQFSRLFAILLLPACALAQDADLILVNGEFYTANSRAPFATAIAVAGERFVYVGEAAGAEALRSPDTRIIDLAGRRVLPGLLDAHTHPGMVAVSHNTVSMELVEDKPTLMRNIQQMLSDNQERDVVVGGFWYNGTFDELGPHKSDLDALEPDRPVILYDYWGHTVWANSKALEVAGVTRDTPDIVPGFAFYQKDENGEPRGWITESAASVFVNNFLSITPEVEKQLLEFLHYLRGLGVTTLLDAGNFGFDDEIYSALSRIDKSQGLPLRYHGAYTLFIPEDYDTAVETVLELNDKYGTDRLRIDTLKIFHDGVIETRTADMFEDYLDTPGNSGNSLFNVDQLHAVMLELEENGLNLHVHSVGNKSTNTLLNAVQQLRATLGRPQSIRIAICHLETVLDSDFYRFKDLGVIASFTPQWHGSVGDDNVYAAIGDEAWSQMRAQPMIADASPVTFSSDITSIYGWQDQSANPYHGMQIGNTRQPVGEEGLARPRSEQLPLENLVDGYTVHAAYQFARENELGSIEVGKRADFVILNQDLFDVDRFDVHKTAPLAVYMDGKLVEGYAPRP